MNNNKLIILIVLLIGNFALGQNKTWSLHECMSVALQNNLEVKIKQLEIAKAQKEHYNPLLDLLPSVNLVGYHKYDFGSTIDPSTNGRISSDIQYDNLYLNATMSILDFNTFASARKSRIDIEKFKANRKVIEYDYKLELLQKYYAALYTQELENIQKNQLKNTILNVDRVKKEVQLGKRAKSDLNDMLLGFSQEERSLLETKQLYEIQKLELFQLMNVTVEDHDKILFQSFIVNKEKSDSKKDISEIPLKNPYITLAELSYESAKRSIAIQRAEALPSLSAYYVLSSFYYNPLNSTTNTVNNFKTQINDNKSQQVGLQLNVPIFNRFKNNKKIAALKIESEKYKLNSKNETLKIQKLIRQELTKRKQYSQLKENLQKTVLYAEKSFKTTQSKFNSDQIEAVIYASVKNQWLSAQYELLKNELLFEYTSLKIKLLTVSEL